MSGSAGGSLQQLSSRILRTLSMVSLAAAAPEPHFAHDANKALSPALVHVQWWQRVHRAPSLQPRNLQLYLHAPAHKAGCPTDPMLVVGCMTSNGTGGGGTTLHADEWPVNAFRGCAFAAGVGTAAGLGLREMPKSPPIHVRGALRAEGRFCLPKS